MKCEEEKEKKKKEEEEDKKMASFIYVRMRASRAIGELMT